MGRFGKWIVPAVAVATVAAGGSAAFATDPVTLPTFGVNASSILAELVTQLGTWIAAAVTLAFGIYALVLGIRMYKRIGR